jgi:hypothetical protein
VFIIFFSLPRDYLIKYLVKVSASELNGSFGEVLSIYCGSGLGPEPVKVGAILPGRRARRAQPIQVVRPCLHHDAAFRKVLRIVVVSADVVCGAMRQLTLDGL